MGKEKNTDLMCILKLVEAGRLESLVWTGEVEDWRERVWKTQEDNPRVLSGKDESSGKEKGHYKDITSLSMRHVGRGYLTANLSLYKLYGKF